MRGYYLFAPVEKSCAGPESGVERKVRSQHKALANLVDCELVMLQPVEYTGTSAEKVVRRLPFTAAWRKWKYNGEFNDADFLYIRQVYHDASFVRYLREIRRQNPKIKIIYEIPTYPYDKEVHVSASNAAFQMKEIINRRRMTRYIDRIVTFYGQEEIWGVPCLKIINGYDFSKVKLAERNLTETINVLSVSATAFWHGYDRFIEGLHQYYENKGTVNVVYYLVGDIKEELREMVSRYGLEEHVVFCGRIPADNLAEYYKNAAIGIDILGGHRKDFPVSSTLKSREYGAYGLPLITSSPVDYLPKDYPYQLLLPYDDSPIDMQSVIDFYHSVYDNKFCEVVAKEIREYAAARCDMAVTMKPVADWLESEHR